MKSVCGGVIGGKAGRRTHAASVRGAVCLVTCSVVAHAHCTQRGVKEACSGVEVPFSPVLLGQRTRQRRGTTFGSQGTQHLGIS